MSRLSFGLVAAIVLTLPMQASAVDCPIGWAAVNALGQNGTTGGGNGPIIYVTTKANLAYYAGLAGPYTILVQGNFVATGNIEVASDKSIIGVGSGTTFNGFGLNINGKKNIIIRNLTIKNVDPDAIAMRDTHHVWVDHCDLSSCSDGLLDITIGSDYVTVSWCRLHNHDKVSLVNSGTQHFEDVGKCRVTYHHNWFYDNVQRNPRVGYGKSHVFNNYYTNISSYCVGYHTGAKVLVENNYFSSCSSPFNQQYSSVPWEASYADAEGVGNLFVSCSGDMTGTGISFDPEFYYDYAFGLDTAAGVPALLTGSAGPAAGNENVVCPTPGNGAIDVHAESDDLLWTNIDGATSWDVYFGTSTTPPYQTSTTTRVFDPGVLAADMDYYWQVDADTTSRLVPGELWRFRTAPAKASKPFPPDGELHAPLRINDTFYKCKPVELTWTPGMGAASYNVYFGTSSTLTSADYKENVTEPLYGPGPLRYGIRYYWRVDMVKGDSSVITGDTWSFDSDIKYSAAGRTESEDMVRNGRYFLQYIDPSWGWFIASNDWIVQLEAGPGTVSSVWAGPYVMCNVSIRYFDENDGVAHYAFYVNETQIDAWFASANNEQIMTRTITSVQIHNGDELRIEVYSDAGELNRTDCMDIDVLPGSWTCSGVSPADLDGNCQVDFVDHAMFATGWAAGDSVADLNDDTYVNWNDVLEFVGDWLACNRDPSSECWQ